MPPRHRRWGGPLRPGAVPSSDLARWPVRPDAETLVAESLRGLLGNALLVSLLLLILAALAPLLTGSTKAALLPGVPGLAAGIAALLARHPRRRRSWLIVSTGAIGLLAFGSLGSLLALDQWANAGLRYQLACLALCTIHLVPAWPVWRRSAALGDRAEAVQAMYDEL